MHHCTRYFNEDFKINVVKFYYFTNMSQRSLAHLLTIDVSTLRRWINKYEQIMTTKNKATCCNNCHQHEITKLRQRIDYLEREFIF